MTEEKYNGWENRSTWLVQVHLDNTTSDIAAFAKEIAVQANTTKQYATRIRALLTATKIRDEVGYDEKAINWRELWDTNSFVQP